jgi:hypothetical protein
MSHELFTRNQKSRLTVGSHIFETFCLRVLAQELPVRVAALTSVRIFHLYSPKRLCSAKILDGATAQKTTILTEVFSKFPR